jgi:hypothetical protein
MDNDRIVEGDYVDVHFEYLRAIYNALVLGLPQDVGDSWRLKAEDGKIIYVQMFSMMERRERKSDSPPAPIS